MTEEAAFELLRDASHLGDDDTDASLVKFTGSERIAGLIDERPLELPSRIFFEANIETLKVVDYPINDVGWPIMSQRMRAALLGVGDFPHREIPVVMLDDTAEVKFNRAGEPLPGVAVHGFAAVQITQYSEAFDWERSEYIRDDLFEDQIFQAKKIVLTNVSLPPVFRLAALPQPLLVSAAGRKALEAAGTQGVKFIPLSQVF